MRRVSPGVIFCIDSRWSVLHSSSLQSHLHHVYVSCLPSHPIELAPIRRETAGVEGVLVQCCISGTSDSGAQNAAALRDEAQRNTLRLASTETRLLTVTCLSWKTQRRSRSSLSRGRALIAIRRFTVPGCSSSTYRWRKRLISWRRYNPSPSCPGPRKRPRHGGHWHIHRTNRRTYTSGE